jgi:ankyrin repeat protein
LREFWKELPPSLDGTYERALQRIDEETWECAHRIFQFLTVSDRPPRVEELAEVFAIQTDEETAGIPEFDASWRPAEAEAAILSACSSLVTVVNVDGEKIVQFSHFSVQDFLTGSRLASSEHLSRYHVVPQSAHTFLARACLSILLCLDTHIHKGSVKKDFPLASYAAEHWVSHARHGDVSSLIGHGNGMECLFDKDKPHFAAWLWVYDIDKPSGPHMVRAHPEKPEATPLYYAASCGFLGLVQWLVKAHPGDVNRINTRSSEGGSSLHAALCKGHLDIALFLLQHRADAKAKDNLCRTPLHIVSRGGYTEVIQPLIAHGAHLNAKDRENKTPLALASRYGRVEAVQLLLKHGADVNRQDSFGSTPLHLALEQGCLPVARVLLEHTADVDARDASGWTPLHRASSNGKVEATRLLLDHKADVNARYQDDWTALRLAEHNGHRQIVELLLQCGAESHIQKEEERKPPQVSPESNDATEVEAAELRSKNGGGEKEVKPPPESNDATQVEDAELRSKNGSGEKGGVPADV